MLNVQRAFSVGGIKPNISVVNNGRVRFLGNDDRVELQSLDRFFSESAIKRMIESNPKIKTMVQNFNPEIKLNMEELKALQEGHSKDTQNIAQEIVNNLPYSIQNQIDQKALNDAAYLHDLGKVLIPKEVLNKPARLNADELKIMGTHSNLGYELLKNSGINQRTLELIKNHHKNKSAFDRILNNKKDYTLQILSTADKYSALTENRVYKNALSPQEALSIIYRDVEKGELDSRIFMALASQAKNNIAELKVS